LVAASVMSLALGAPAVRADTAAELLQAAKDALKSGEPKKALELATKAIEQDPKEPKAYFLRGRVHELLQENKEALADFTKVVDLDPKMAEAYDHRGSAQFKLGRIKESIADFDTFLKANPKAEPGHWRRGISYYYAGRFEDGKKQFEGYEKVDTNDVENAVWRYLCQAKLVGVEKARADILKIGNDRRVPMMQVYALFAGKAKPEDVLAAANAGEATAEQRNARLFYAHLYLGLYCDAAGDKKRTEEHMTKAVEHRIGHYMWDVAR